MPAADIDLIAILRLDGDWYASTKVCLEHLFDRVVPGGFIVIDDFGAYEGCRSATEEFFEMRSDPAVPAAHRPSGLLFSESPKSCVVTADSISLHPANRGGVIVDPDLDERLPTKFCDDLSCSHRS